MANWGTCVKIKILRRVLLNRRVDLHAIDATPSQRRGGMGLPPLDGASTAASLPRNDFMSAPDTLVDFHAVGDDVFGAVARAPVRHAQAAAGPRRPQRRGALHERAAAGHRVLQEQAARRLRPELTVQVHLEQRVAEVRRRAAPVPALAYPENLRRPS